MRAPYLPGNPPGRQWNNYNPHQELMWDAFDSAYMGHYFGFAGTRQPTPGIDRQEPEKYQSWLEQFEQAWQQEAGRDSRTRGLKMGEYPDHLMEWLHQRFWDARGLKTAPVVTTSVSA